MTENISRLTKFTFISAILLIGLLFAGCNQHTDKISDINDNPSKYENQSVTLVGDVTQVFSLPLGISDIAAYKIDDGTGSIWVITHDGAPEKNAKLGIKGTVKSVKDSLPSEVSGYLSSVVGDIVNEQERRAG
jgi:hypothetical protein